MDYGTLRTDFKNLLSRDDCTDELADTFLRAGISRILRTLRVPTMERVLPITVDADGFILIPSDYLELIDLYQGDIYANTTATKLKKLELGEFIRKGVTGETKYYTRIQGKWYLKDNPGAGETITAYYYGDLATLENDEDTDPLLEIAHDVFLYAAMYYAADHFSDERASAFAAKFPELLNELQGQSVAQEFSEGYLAVEPGTSSEY